MKDPVKIYYLTYPTVTPTFCGVAKVHPELTPFESQKQARSENWLEHNLARVCLETCVRGEISMQELVGIMDIMDRASLLGTKAPMPL